MKNLNIYVPIKVIDFYTKEVINDKKLSCFYSEVKNAIQDFNTLDCWNDEFKNKGIMAYFHINKMSSLKKVKEKIKCGFMDTTMVITEKGITLFGICKFNFEGNITNLEIGILKLFLQEEYKKRYKTVLENTVIEIVDNKNVSKITVSFEVDEYSNLITDWQLANKGTYDIEVVYKNLSELKKEYGEGYINGLIYG